MLSAAVRDGYLARNPVDDVRRLKATPKAQPFLQLDQVEPLLKVTQAKDRPLLLTLEGWHQNPANFRTRVLAPAIERANARLRFEDKPRIPALTPHALRHTYCSLLIAQGEDLSTVAAQMRHADLSTTLRVYTHVMKHRREGVAQRLDEALWGNREAVVQHVARGKVA